VRVPRQILDIQEALLAPFAIDELDNNFRSLPVANA
jgi:hypothetical protein